MIRRFMTGRSPDTIVTEDRPMVSGIPVHCGDPVEVLVDCQWIRGTVEWSREFGWYVVLPQDDWHRIRVMLSPGIVVRQP